MNWKRFAIVIVPVVSLVLGVPGAVFASGNLVSNGGFESLTNGYGQLGSVTTATSWFCAPPDGSYNFVLNTSNAITGVNTQFNTPLALWGIGNGGTTAITASPDGGNFAALDGAFHSGSLSQTINGLNVGSTYTLTFFWGATQQMGFDGDTTDFLTASLGSESHNTRTINLASHGFDAWHAVSMQFTATSVSEALAFLATSTPSGVPPLALLDGVSLTENISTPEPATLSLVAIGILSAVALHRRSRARRV